jgi:hypothetical protein
VHFHIEPVSSSGRPFAIASVRLGLVGLGSAKMGKSAE